MSIDLGDIFGRSVGFPPRLDEQGRVRWSAGPDNVRESIRVILLTEPGERLMLPGFGAGLRKFLFQPNTTVTHRAIEDAVMVALARWEPRITNVNVQVSKDEQDEKAVLVLIHYMLVATQQNEDMQLRVVL